MMNRHRSFALAATLVTLIGWLAVPYASQNGANEGFILFTSDRDNPSNRGICPSCEDIYVMAPDGSEATRLTYGGGPETDPAAHNNGGADWSHAKKLIAFLSNRVGRIPQIYLMNPDGTDQQLLVSLPGGAAFPGFSQSGNELCFNSRTTPRDIYIVNIHGTGLTNLTSPGREAGQPGVNGNNIRCDWSPKANAIAFTSNRDGNEEIYVMEADGSGVHRLTDAAGSDANPAFSPKGNLIAFESNRAPHAGKPEIYVMNADGTGDPVRLTFFSNGPNPTNISVTKPTWSPRGDRIAFHRRVGAPGTRGHFEVYTMDADGTNLTQITSTASPGFSGFPSWGKWSAR
ncbi:MAG TPA: hypothetical protein VNJ04_10595 [Gemmatimonadaceae bacterium]|nr:hypothetical protein [Gemmatimonadaceae bacterium]